MARVDLHLHLLPGVDDGPRTLEESVEVARLAVADGTSRAMVTPHLRSDHLTDAASVPARTLELAARLEDEGIPLSLVPGAELGHDMVGRLGQADFEAVAAGPPGARWLLLESPFDGHAWEDWRDAAEELRDRGFGVVMAHPERSPIPLASLRAECARGSILQVNAGSLAGGHGERARLAALDLLGAGLAALLASDGHSAVRPPELQQGLEATVHAGLPAVAAELLVSGRPAGLLAHGVASQPCYGALAAP
ncbi:MAG TPA: CpsB/CapC family capsule biosynthesis tyrosine phosphatase [Thermoleophilaceae bacterium]|nr:CpsB/CapC family capsule biosynthesis tyrosine phosphatase [Thermoleophilaceae bacterium]